MQEVCKKCGAVVGIDILNLPHICSLRKKFLKHPLFEQGRRTHVEYWVGKQNWDGTISGETRCSEPNCELNNKDMRISEVVASGPTNRTNFSFVSHLTFVRTLRGWLLH